MKSVLVRLQEYRNQASGAEKSVIKILIENPEAVSNYSIHALASESYASASTIIRLCQKLGFKGYRELHTSLVYELALRQSTSDEKGKEISKDDALETILDKVTYKNIISLENTRKLIDLNTLQQCIDLLINARTICLFGMGSSLLVAKDAYLKFLRINKPCNLSEDWHAQLLQSKNMTQDDIAIAISYSGLTEEVLRCVEIAKDNGSPVIAITRFEDNPLSRLADYTLSVAATEFIFRSGAMSSRIAQLNIIDILYTAFINKEYELSVKQFEKTHIDKTAHEESDNRRKIF
ncbi:MurR/RpiR family transcriptional regulator [Fusibacter ferrireducens]|uniref:MurR/RpiR family transcriptional regulator n=1 Tax=Fusibacter ferrireducens TaxID=2785058 RepID=A0ABR9ZRK7_9FIRM|nr:MurR/RpiR family transcriptional regulator [Fusibacter ferrireducens]MBF4692961.1 MurR/RpiR family transcriptional regulator [Fusibacter ferrireducens]